MNKDNLKNNKKYGYTNYKWLYDYIEGLFYEKWDMCTYNIDSQKIRPCKGNNGFVYPFKRGIRKVETKSKQQVDHIIQIEIKKIIKKYSWIDKKSDTGIDKEDIPNICYLKIMELTNNFILPQDTREGEETQRFNAYIVKNLKNKVTDYINAKLEVIRNQRTVDKQRYSFYYMPNFSVDLFQDLEFEEGESSYIIDSAVDSYRSYGSTYIDYKENEYMNVAKDVIANNLTNRQKEYIEELLLSATENIDIFNIRRVNITKTAKKMGVSRQAVKNVIKQVKNKIDKKYNINYTDKYNRMLHEKEEITPLLNKIGELLDEQGVKTIIDFVRDNIDKEFIIDYVLEKMKHEHKRYLIKNFLRVEEKINNIQETVIRMKSTKDKAHMQYLDVEGVLKCYDEKKLNNRYTKQVVFSVIDALKQYVNYIDNYKYKNKVKTKQLTKREKERFFMKDREKELIEKGLTTLESVEKYNNIYHKIYFDGNVG
ncbi:hypothetical protein [Clostridiisalibacter paucivorans]|uniref:hypothetical protein n=1 Tax=Clostridiisalibacter paucivorans TaxID=408753 RepID=UPI00047C16A3|nr:hypothetical protein [Clostridiisalibacter paucivorans]